MLRLRLITGPLLIAALLAIMWLDGVVDGAIALRWDADDASPSPRGIMLFLLAALAIVPLASVELAALLRAAGVRAPTGLTVASAEIGLLAGTLGVSAALLAQRGPVPPIMLHALALGLPMTLLVAAAVLGWGRRTDGIGSGLGAALLAFVAVGMLPAFFVAMRQVHDPWLVVGVILTAKSCDIGAYFTGRSLGRRRLIPWLSPGKTWEGLIGGVLTAGAVGGLLAWWSLATGDGVPIAAGIVGGIALGVAGQAGDLAESLLKRSADAKDSGSTLPGMGGILDVIDSLLPAGPVALLVLLLMVP